MSCTGKARVHTGGTAHGECEWLFLDLVVAMALAADTMGFDRVP